MTPTTSNVTQNVTDAQEDSRDDVRVWDALKAFFEDDGENLLWGLAGFLTAVIIFFLCSCISRYRTANSIDETPSAQNENQKKAKIERKPVEPPHIVSKSPYKVRKTPNEVQKTPNEVQKTPNEEQTTSNEEQKPLNKIHKPERKVRKNPNNVLTKEDENAYSYCDQNIAKPAEMIQTTKRNQTPRRESYDVVDFNRVPSDENIDTRSEAEENFYDIGLQKLSRSRKQSTTDPAYFPLVKLNTKSLPTETDQKRESWIEDSGLNIYDDVEQKISFLSHDKEKAVLDIENKNTRGEIACEQDNNKSNQIVEDEDNDKTNKNYGEGDDVYKFDRHAGEDDDDKKRHHDVIEGDDDNKGDCDAIEGDDDNKSDHDAKRDNDSKLDNDDGENNDFKIRNLGHDVSKHVDVTSSSLESVEGINLWNSFKDEDSGISGSEAESKDPQILPDIAINMLYEEFHGKDDN